MRKTILCLAAVVFSYGCFLPAVHAIPCHVNQATGEPILNSPPNCTPSPQQESQETTEYQQDQPATDSEPSFKELRKTAETSTEARRQAEEAYEKEKSLYEEARRLGLDEESVNLIKADLDAKEKALNEAEEREREAREAAAEKGKEESYYTRERMHKEMNDKADELASQAVNLPNMGITLGSEITTIDSTFSNVIKFLSRAIGIIAVLSIMAGGVILTVSSADEELQTKAKDIILYSILAVVFVLCAYAIVTGIQQIIYSLGE